MRSIHPYQNRNHDAVLSIRPSSGTVPYAAHIKSDAVKSKESAFVRKKADQAEYPDLNRKNEQESESHALSLFHCAKKK